MLGLLIALGIGIPGLGLYLGARELGLNTQVQASGLADNWWTVPVLILSAVQNAMLEEVIVIGYLFTRLGSARLAPPGDHHRQRADPRLVPPLPGLRRLRSAT